MAIDPKLIDDLNSRRKKVILSGGQEKIDKRHEKGEMTARDRMGYLFEEGTFSEIGMHVRHNCHNFGMGKKEIPGDGVVSGFGLVDGRPVACAASDFLAQGGSLGYMHAMKIADAQKYALKGGSQMGTVIDSGGARIQEGVAALSQYGRIFKKTCEASGFVPQISIILGPCAGGGLSAHADQRGLLDWFGHFDPKPPLALVHGEDKAREALAGEIGERDGIEVVLVRPGMTVDA